MIHDRKGNKNIMETVRLSDKLELTRVIVGCMRMMDAGKKVKTSYVLSTSVWNLV